MISFKRTVLNGLAIAAGLMALAASAEARPWQEHSGRLSQLSRQIENKEHEIRELIEKKRHRTDPKAVAEIIRQIEDIHKSILKTAKDYEEERKHVRFDHPERNDQLNRNYVRFEVKSIEDLENELGLDARLDRVKARALALFPLPVKEKKPDPPKLIFVRKPASLLDDEDAPEKIHLVK